MSYLAVVQGSEEWLKARCGSLGASRLHDALARTKGGWGASRKNLVVEKAVERLTGLPADGFTNGAMQWGIDHEDEARAAYAFMAGNTVETVGLFTHPDIPFTHASPDGLVGDDGMVEIKCPQSATHAEYLLSRQIPDKYLLQIFWQMECTGRRWCDFVSYDPRFPDDLKIFILRVERDDERLNVVREEVQDFLAEVSEMVTKLKEARS